jgi:hypothetical protein
MYLFEKIPIWKIEARSERTVYARNSSASESVTNAIVSAV